MQYLLALIRRFQADERGAFLAMFGLLAVVLIATAGAVVDYTSVEQAKTRAQVALDASALALQPMIYKNTWTTEQIRVAAEDLMVERLGDDSIVAEVVSATPNTAAGTLRLVARLNVPMNFVALVGVQDMTVGLVSTSARGSTDIEVAIALDITLSMQGSKITALRDATAELIDLVVKDSQVPNYSKMALVPYSNGVNLGATYAPLARGTPTSYTDITDASWLTAGASMVISAINKANPGRITTSAAHGLSTGDTVYVSNIAGGGFTALNGRSFTITKVNATQFTLNSTSTSGYSGSYTANSGVVTTGTKRAISAISKANPGRITTALPHGYSTGDAVYVTSVAGGGYTALNTRTFTITVNSPTQFSLNSTSTNGYSGTYSAGTGFVQECLTNECEVVVTSAAHGLSNGEHVYVTNVGGMTQINSSVNSSGRVSSSSPMFAVSDRTANTFVLEDSTPESYGTYTSGGRAYCTIPGCQYYFFEDANNNNSYNLYAMSTCVTERTGSHKYDDTAPGTAPVGYSYPPPSSSSLGACPPTQVQPLTDNKTTLSNIAANLSVTGSTAGQIGLAWAWYMLSPNFASMWPAANQPADPDVNHNLVKVVILMTDGAFNTAYCNGVTSKNYGVVNNSESNNCNATNGNPFTQAEALCDAIKDEDIILYTVAFDLGSDANATSLMADCATDEAHAYTAANGSDLSAAFQQIGENISALRLSD